ncbi:MAG: MBL fold metallo-hydrolase [Clostridia bacterium]|nr:MBL fold metallo-hydrolase [Clostridia bacterium]
MKFDKNTYRKIVGIVCVIVSLILSFTYYLKDRFGDNTDPLKYDYVNGNYVEFIDVGQGDCTLIASKGKYCLIDTGPADGYKNIRKELKDKGIKNIDLIIISHYHADHTGSLQSIVNNFNVANLIFPPEYPDTNVSNDVLYAKKECIAEDGEFYFAKTGQTITIGDFKLTILYQTGDLSEENNRSLYVMAKIDDKKFLFTGDGESAEESKLLNENYDLDCDVLKVAHHGGRTSSTQEFLKQCTPKYSVISCAKKNQYNHPHKETIKRLRNIKSKVYNTKDRGNITFIYNDSYQLNVSTQK